MPPTSALAGIILVFTEIVIVAQFVAIFCSFDAAIAAVQHILDGQRRLDKMQVLMLPARC